MYRHLLEDFFLATGILFFIFQIVGCRFAFVPEALRGFAFEFDPPDLRLWFYVSRLDFGSTS